MTQKSAYQYVLDCFNLPREEQVLKGMGRSSSSLPHALSKRPLQMLIDSMHSETYN